MTAHSGDAWKGARFLGGWRQSDGGLSLCPCPPRWDEVKGEPDRRRPWRKE